MAIPLFQRARSLFAPAQPDDHDRTLLQRSVGTLGLSLTSTLVAVGISVLLARMLGASGYGSYTYAKTWIGVLGILAPLGFDVLALRGMAEFEARRDWGALKGLLRTSMRSSLACSLALAVVGAGFALLAPVEDAMRMPLLIALGLLPLAAVARIQAGAIQGLQHVMLAQLPGAVVQPLLLVTGIFAAWFALDGTLTASVAMGIQVVVGFVVVVVLGVALARIVPEPARAAETITRTRAWLGQALPLVFANGTFILLGATDTLMLGLMSDAEAVGTYAVAKRGATLITFLTAAIGTALGPTIASLWAQGETATLQRLLVRAIRGATLCSLPLGLGFALFAEPILSLFGPEFTAGSSVLVTLALAHTARVALGLGPLVLFMTGYERDAAIAAAGIAAANVALNLVLIPRFGIEGAAVATAACLMAIGGGLAWHTRRRTGLRTTVFA